MRTVSISEFTVNGRELLEEMVVIGEPFVVTSGGVPIAQIGPPSAQPVRRRELGCMRGRGSIIGDLVAPVSTIDEWDAQN